MLRRTIIFLILLMSMTMLYASDQLKNSDLASLEQKQKQLNEIIEQLDQSQKKFNKDFDHWVSSISEADIYFVNGKEQLAPSKSQQGCHILQQIIDDLDGQMNKIRILADELGSSTEELPKRDQLIEKIDLAYEDFKKIGMQCLLH